MQFGHEQLDGYRISIRYVTWAYYVAQSLKGSNRPARDQLLRASPSIPLNIAEGNGKEQYKNHRNTSFGVGRNSAAYCAVWAPEGMRRNTAIAYCARRRS